MASNFEIRKYARIFEGRLQGMRVYCISTSSFGIVLDGHHVSIHLDVRRKLGYMLRVG